MRSVANFVGFQAGWFACVLGAGGGHPLAGPAAAAALVALHLLFLAHDRGAEARLLCLVVPLGCALSAFNAWNGAVDFADGGPELAGVPLWIAALWALFGATLRHSLAWLGGRPLLAALLGLVGSPLSYLGAARLGAVTVHDDPLRGPLVLGLTWAVAVPALLLLARRPAPTPQPG